MQENNRVLVIDDDPGILEAYSEILNPKQTESVLAKGAALFDEPEDIRQTPELKRYTITLAKRGEEAVGYVRQAIETNTPFAAAFVDMSMPGIDGAETTRRIWAIDPAIHVVIVTAFSEYTPDNIIKITGRDDIFYLRKPFNPEEIRQFARAFTTQWNLEQERNYLADQLKTANQELEDMNRNLRKKVEEQAAMLLQSEKMSSVGILAAGVAHEINNPIAFISSNLSSLKTYNRRIRKLLLMYRDLEKLIRNGEAGDATSLLDDIRNYQETRKIDFILSDMVQLADESHDGALRIRDIVNDLKTFSRVDDARAERIDLNQLLEATLKIIRPELKGKAVVKKHYGGLPPVRCLPQKINQVFLNILINAVQSVDPDGTIRVSTRFLDRVGNRPDSMVEVTITDNGRGISPDDIHRVFDPFFTTKPVGQGTGLGLSIAYDIINAHDGEIHVDSTIDRGSTFTVRLPAEGVEVASEGD